MWELDHKKGWAPKNQCFRTVVWRRLFKVPWTARRSSQSILKEINPEYSWEDWRWSWSSNTLATWCEELTHWRRPWCWEGLGAGGKGDVRGWDSLMASLTWWTWVWENSGSWGLTGRPGVLQFKGTQSRKWLSNWTELNWTKSRKRKRVPEKHLLLLSWLCQSLWLCGSQ